ncbi:MAG: hypothetical protein NQU42_06340 [Methanothrix sp.]|uniref:hypothetical protein n=1 Tax=Methanothrix sp. TaxID=90426 RepID=UPI0025D6C1B5|nr:hypothetical protein [Methanothrix sp.]MCQ8903693.1 hypothetical protein [Methanothrix sp.]
MLSWKTLFPLFLLLLSGGLAEEWTEGQIEGDIPISGDVSYARDVSSGQPSGDSAPEALMSFDLEENQPQAVYFGTKEVSFSSYRSMISGANTLWIADGRAWRQYTTCPLGDTVSLVATTPYAGPGDLIEIYPSGSTDTRRYWFSTYSYLRFYGDTPGRHILLFVKDNLPSNAVIIDVTGGRYVPPDYAGLALITVTSGTLRGFDVFVDDTYRYRDVDDGLIDGTISFTVLGNMNHKIAVLKGGYSYVQTRYFAAGRSYTLRI